MSVTAHHHKLHTDSLGYTATPYIVGFDVATAIVQCYLDHTLSVPQFINLMRLVGMFHGYCLWLACQSSLYSSAYLSGKAFPNPQAIISLALHNSNQINRSKD